MFMCFLQVRLLNEGSRTLRWPPLLQYDKWKKQLRGDKSSKFRPPKVAKKEVSLLELSKYTSTVQREVGC